MPPSPRLIVAALALSLTALAGAAQASHRYGSCPPAGVERCERWAAVSQDPSVGPSTRPDQFGAGVVSTGAVTIAVAKEVLFDSASPYDSDAVALLQAYSTADGSPAWTARYTDRAYVNVTAAAVSPDGGTVFITGGAYDGFPVGATDAQLLVAAFNTRDGALLWASHWDGRPDATDNGKAIVVSPDGTEVYAAGVTTTSAGDLDYVTVGFSAADGQQLWASTYAGPGLNVGDAVFGLAVNPVHQLLYVTGWSGSEVEYDADYATVAYHLGSAGGGTQPPDKGNGKGKDKPKKHAEPPAPAGPPAGSVAWVARYDGVGQRKSDRANAVAVSADGAHVVVTGDSFAGRGGGDYDYATVGYDALTGAQQWSARYSGVRGGFNAANRIAAAGGLVVVAGQSAGPQDEGNNAVAVAYDVATGAQRWVSTVAPSRSDDYSRALLLAPDGSTAYLLTTDTPIVQYTALSRVGLRAIDATTGATRWESAVDGGSLNALGGTSLALAPGGQSLAVLADLKRSADPLGSQSQNIYDVVTAVFAT